MNYGNVAIGPAATAVTEAREAIKAIAITMMALVVAFFIFPPPLLVISDTLSLAE
jgi:hypothetical protein